MSDPVNHPSHYTYGGIEVIDAIEAWGLGFCLGNTVKYVARAEHKGKPLEDLMKARWYLDREIKSIESRRAKALGSGWVGDTKVRYCEHNALVCDECPTDERIVATHKLPPTASDPQPPRASCPQCSPVQACSYHG